MCEKVRRAVGASKECSNGDFIICARTDAAGVTDIDDAIRRAKAYVECGADMIFPEGLKSEAEFKKFADEMHKLPFGKSPHGGPYLLANMTEFGATPYISTKSFAQLGYNCVIHPVSALRMAMKPVQEMLNCLDTNGTVEPVLEKMLTRTELYSILKYNPSKEWNYPAINEDA